MNRWHRSGIKLFRFALKQSRGSKKDSGWDWQWEDIVSGGVKSYALIAQWQIYTTTLLLRTCQVLHFPPYPSIVEWIFILHLRIEMSPMYGKRLIVSLIDQYAADESEKLYASIPTNEGTSPRVQRHHVCPTSKRDQSCLLVAGFCSWQKSWEFRAFCVLWT